MYSFGEDETYWFAPGLLDFRLWLRAKKDKHGVSSMGGGGGGGQGCPPHAVLRLNQFKIPAATLLPQEF